MPTYPLINATGVFNSWLTTETKVVEISDGILKCYHIAPEEFGFARCAKEELIGGNAEENAKITLAILNGTEKGPKRDVVLLNSAMALYTAGKGESVGACVELARKLIDSGSALRKLNQFVALSNAVMPAEVLS